MHITRRLWQGLAALLVASCLSTMAADVEDLLKQLKYGTMEQRRLAARDLGDSGDARAVQPLIDCFSVEDPILPGVAAAALGKLGPVARPALMKAVEGPKSQISGWAAEAIALGSQASVPELKKMLVSGDPKMQKIAISALQDLKDGSCTAELVKFQMSEQRELRYMAATALSRSGYKPQTMAEQVTHLAAKGAWDDIGTLGPEATKEILPWLKWNEERAGAVQALSTIKGPDAIEAITKTLETHAEPSAAYGLLKFGDEGIANLAKATESEKAGVRKAACEALGDHPQTSKATWALLAVLHDDKDEEVRHAAADAIRNYKGPEVIQGLLKALQDPNEAVRGSASYGLQNRIGAFKEENYEAFEKLLDGNKEAKELALRTLKEKPDARAKGKLLSLIEGTQDAEMRHLAMCTIGKLKDSEVADTLMKWTQRGDELDRYSAVEGLTEMQDPRAYNLILRHVQSFDYSKDNTLQCLYVRLLGKTGDRRAVEKLQEIYEKTKIKPTYLDAEFSSVMRVCRSLVCCSAVEALGELRKNGISGDSVLKTLEDAKGDYDLGVRAAAKEALGEGDLF